MKSPASPSLDDFHARLGAVGLHELAQCADFRQVEVLEKRRERDETVNPVDKLCGGRPATRAAPAGPFRVSAIFGLAS